MSISTATRRATAEEMAVEMDRRGAAIEALEAKVARLEQDLAIANRGGLDLLYAIRKAIGWTDKHGLSLLPDECGRLFKAAQRATTERAA